MSVNRPLEARKLPSQKRSEMMLEKIHLATREVLANEGLEYLSTKRIAKQAGLSPGSLYQYYPNKQAIIYAIGKNWLDHTMTVAEEYYGLRAKFKIPGAWFKEMLMESYAPFIRASPKQRKLDIEISTAIRLYPELNNLNTKQGEEMARHLAETARHFGSQWPDEKLHRFCFYLFQLSISFEDICARSDENLKERLEWHAKAVATLYETCLSP